MPFLGSNLPPGVTHQGVKSLQRTSLTIVRGRTKVREPFFYHFVAAGFDNQHDIAERSGGNVRVVVAEIAASRSGNPYLCGVACGRTLGDMHVYRL